MIYMNASQWESMKRDKRLIIVFCIGGQWQGCEGGKEVQPNYNFQ
jgi:hypothetical protein